MNEMKRMTEEDLVRAFHSDVEDAVSFIDSDIAPERTLATNFYHARPFGDEESGRSQIVMPVIRDTVRSMMPSLMRVFYGGQRIVEFVPSGNVPYETADLMTESVIWVFNRLNPGFRITWDAFKDALVRKVGFIKWWWDDSVRVSARVYDGVTEEQLLAYEASKGDGGEVEVVSATVSGEVPAVPDQVDPVTGAVVPGSPAQPVYTYKIRVVTRQPVKQVRVTAVPVDEVFIDRWARSLDDAKVVGHRCVKRKGDLVAMGISPDVLAEVAGATSISSTNGEVLARAPYAGMGPSSETDDQKSVLLTEGYYRIDFDGDGISELRRIVTVGDNHKLVSNEYASEVQLAEFCPDPEPHVLFGMCPADYLIDMQLIESHVTRDVMDSLKASIFPRTSYVEGQVNVDDILNTEIGAAIRQRQPGMVQVHEVPFVGQQAMPILEHLDAIKERRTGVRGSSPVLDAKALQSTNQVAVNAAVTGAQAQVELVARIFAETGFKRVMRGILRLLVENQALLNIEYQGQRVKVDASGWDIDAEISVNTGLGMGDRSEKVELMKFVGQGQAAAIMQLGPDNPLCSLKEMYNTHVRILELNGMRDVSRFWRDPEQWDQPPEPPQPSPEQVLAEAQMRIEASKLELEQLQTVLKDDLERDKLDADIALRAAEIKAKYATDVDVASIKASIERLRMRQDAKLASARSQSQATQP